MSDAITIGKHAAVGIFDDARAVGNVSLVSLGPFKGAGDALPFIGMFKDFIEGAFGTGGMGHSFRESESKLLHSSILLICNILSSYNINPRCITEDSKQLFAIFPSQSKGTNI